LEIAFWVAVDAVQELLVTSRGIAEHGPVISELIVAASTVYQPNRLEEYYKQHGMRLVSMSRFFVCS
jgi:hypothetical protein